METLPTNMAIAASFLFAGTVKGVIGLGLPAVAIGFLSLLMTPAHAAAILVVPSLVTNIWQGVSGGGLSELLERLWPLLIGICIGTLLAAFYLPAGGHWATVFLGLALMLYAALGLVKAHFSVPKHAEKWVGMLAGMATGVITATTGVSAIPCVPYLQALHLERNRLVQALGLSFTVSTVALAAALSHAGEMHMSLVGTSSLALIAAFAGMGLGQVIRHRIKAETFRLYFFFGLLVLGARLALRDLI